MVEYPERIPREIQRRAVGRSGKRADYALAFNRDIAARRTRENVGDAQFFAIAIQHFDGVVAQVDIGRNRRADRRIKILVYPRPLHKT